MKLQYLLSALLIIGFTSCRNQFVTNTYENRKYDHKRIAVIPLKSIYTGKIPEELTEEDIVKIEDAEGVRFQELINGQLSREAGIRNQQITIEIISASVTNSKLESAGICVREAESLDPTI